MKSKDVLTVDFVGEILRYAEFQDVPPDVLDTMCKRFGRKYRTEVRDLFEEGARLYIVVTDRTPASVLWCKSGMDIPGWYTKLDPNDIVLFAMYTFKKYRGKGLITWLTNYAISFETSCGANRVLANTDTFNSASLHALERAGFNIIGRCGYDKILD